MTPWLATIAAAIAVIVGGWFLGQALAHIFNPAPGSSAAQQQPTPLSVTPLPSPTPTEVAAATPQPSPTPTVQSSPSVKPTAAPTPTLAPTVAPTPQPTVAPTQTPLAEQTAQTRQTQPIARRPEVTAAPATQAPAVASSVEDAASRTVRAYIEALRNGDPQSAALYLGNGTPDESFIDGNTRIASVNSTRNADGSYKVEVDMRTAQGEYFETFLVAATANGNRILDKTAIKP